MNITAKLITVLLTLTLLWSAMVFDSTALAAPLGPLETLRKRADEFVAVMNDPRYKSASAKAEQRRRIWEVVVRTIYFKGLTGLALGKHWDNFTGGQQDEIADAFAELMGVSYLDLLQERYNNERLEFIDEKLIQERKALVRVRVVRPGLNIPVNIKMVMVKDRWLAYDAQVEGISLVSNFRAQFYNFLMDKTPRDLIVTMRARIRQQRARKGLPEKDDNYRRLL